MSMGTPFDSVSSAKRQIRACFTMSWTGYHLKGMFTTSTRKPRALRAEASSVARISAPPTTNGACTEQTQMLRRGMEELLRLLLQGSEALGDLRQLLAGLPERALEVEVVLLGGFERKLDPRDEIVNVADELLLQDEVPFVDLLHAPAVNAENPIVVAAHFIQTLLHLPPPLLVESNLCGVHPNLTLHERSEREPNEAGER